MAKYEGAGGYGGISTLNQEHRQGRFYPHTNIIIIRQHPTSRVKCFTCQCSWTEGNDYPAKCLKPATEGSEILEKQ